MNDPNFFRMDWEQLFEVLAGIIVLSVFVERGLALVFESHWFEKVKKKGIKEPIAFVTSALICVYCQFDAVAIIFHKSENHYLGYIITATIVAGGSKASIKLFRDLLGISREIQSAGTKKKSVKARSDA